MAVPIHETGNQRLAAKVDELRCIALCFQNIGLRTDGENFPILHRECLGGGRGVMDRDDVTAGVDRVGSNGSGRRGALRTAGDEQQRAQGGACGLE